MGFIIGRAVQILIEVYILIIVVDVILSYILSPYHKVRMFLDGLVNPLLNPLRRIIPPLGMLDLSPLVLLILVQVIGSLLVNILFSIP